jgi:hypothetical protein
MTDRDVVEHVAKLIGRAVVQLRQRKPHHKLPYATTIKGAPATRVMYAVRPFLCKTRRLQIDRAISTWRSRRGSQHRPRKDAGDAPSRVPSEIALLGLLTPPTESRAARDQAWLAGVLEGEGSFLSKRRARNSYPVIKVEMCDLEVIEHVAVILNARVWVEGPREEGWRPTYIAQIAGQHAADWMSQLRPYMGLRRTAAIDAALASYQPIRLIAPPPTCLVTGCERPHRSRGLCNTHYMSWSRDRAKGRTPRVTPLR